MDNSLSFSSVRRIASIQPYGASRTHPQSMLSLFARVPACSSFAGPFFVDRMRCVSVYYRSASGRDVCRKHRNRKRVVRYTVMRPVLSLQVTARAKAKLLSFGDLCPSNCTDIGRKKETSCVRRYQPLHPSDCCWQRMARRYRESESTSTFLSSCKSEMTRGLNCVFISSPSPTRRLSSSYCLQSASSGK